MSRSLRPIAIRVADTFQWNYFNEVHWEIQGITSHSHYLWGSPWGPPKILRNSIWVYLFIFWKRFWDILSEMPDAWKLNSSEMTLVLDDRRWWRSWKLHGDLQGLAKVLKTDDLEVLAIYGGSFAQCKLFHFPSLDKSGENLLPRYLGAILNANSSAQFQKSSFTMIHCRHQKSVEILKWG